jgi:exosome complex RNA-binding protein Csl4
MKNKSKQAKQKAMCPNCKKTELEKVFDELVCMHCEYHTHRKKKPKASFR